MSKETESSYRGDAVAVMADIIEQENAAISGGVKKHHTSKPQEAEPELEVDPEKVEEIARDLEVEETEATSEEEGK